MRDEGKGLEQKNANWLMQVVFLEKLNLQADPALRLGLLPWAVSRRDAILGV